MAWLFPWMKRKPITINGAAFITGTVNNLPVLVDFAADAQLAAGAQVSGNDILFADADGTTALKYDRAFYNNATGGLSAFAKNPSLTNVNKQMFLYYKNAAAPDQQDKLNTWNSNFLRCWKFNETSGLACIDVVANDNSIFINPGGAHNGAGLIGANMLSQTFNGTTNFQTNNPTVAPAMPIVDSARTFMLWARPTNVAAVFRFAAAYGAAAVNQLWGIGRSGTNLLFAGFGSDISIVGVLAAGVKFHAAWTHDPTLAPASTTFGFLNGVSGVNAVKTYNTASGGVGYQGARIPGVEFWIGEIGMIRCSNSPLPANYIKATYDTENSPATFITIGAEENPPADLLYVYNRRRRRN